MSFREKKLKIFDKKFGISDAIVFREGKAVCSLEALYRLFDTALTEYKEEVLKRLPKIKPPALCNDGWNNCLEEVKKIIENI